MDTPDDKKKLYEQFAALADRRPRDPASALLASVTALRAGKSQISAGMSAVPRADPGERPQGLRQRFPELPGLLPLFADGLAENTDIAEEIGAGPDTLRGAAVLDMAVGRLYYVGQLVAEGGETGESLAGAGAFRLCQDLLGEAQARKEDATTPAAVRSDIDVAFALPEGTLQDQQVRLAAAQATTARAELPLQEHIDQKQQDAELSKALNDYMTRVLQGEGPA